MIATRHLRRLELLRRLLAKKIIIQNGWMAFMHDTTSNINCINDNLSSLSRTYVHVISIERIQAANKIGATHSYELWLVHWRKKGKKNMKKNKQIELLSFQILLLRKESSRWIVGVVIVCDTNNHFYTNIQNKDMIQHTHDIPWFTTTQWN